MGIEKLVTCAMEAGSHVTHDYAVRAVASGIDLIVYVELETSSKTSEASEEIYRRRYVSEIMGVELGGDSSGGYQVTDIFVPNPEGGPGRATNLPHDHAALERYGFNAAAFNREAGK